VYLPSQLTEVFHKTVGISHKTVKGLHKTVGGLPQGAVRHRSRLRSCRPSRARFSDVPHRSCSSCTIPSTKTHQIGAKSGYFSFITTGAISSYVMMKFRSQSNQEITRKRVYKMQTVYGQSSSKLNPQTRKIATIAIVLFALSGLISGFAVGAFVHHRPATVTTHKTSSGSKSVVRITQPPVITSTPEIVTLSEPQITDFISSETANNSTSYSLSALIIDKANSPIQASDVTCKLWLTKDANVSSDIKTDNGTRLESIGIIQQPFPGDVSGLNFTTTQQTQACTPNGKTTWNYTVSSTVDSGIYYLVVLADWQGKHSSWRWIEVRIKKAH